jgi:ABC-type Fe3+/spermidine/putrescine transport system ATPase subunit
LWPHLTVAENVAFGLEERKRPKPEIRERVDEALAVVRLDGLGERRIQQLSGGQQQRVALARALVIRPHCLLLDEPLSNLDAQLRLEMRREIRRICKQFGLTGVYVTHDQEEALSMADRLAVMDAGRLVQIGTPIEVYRNPVSRMVAEFIGETNFIEGQVHRAGDDPGTYEVETAAGRLVARGIPAAGLFARHGARVVLSVRPEALRFSKTADSAPNRFAGRIIETVYLGSTVQYRLQLESGPMLKLTEMNPSRILPASEQSAVAVAAVDDVILLPE